MLERIMSHFHKDLDRDGTDVRDDVKERKAENVTAYPDRE